MQQHEMEARKGGVAGRVRTVCALMSLAGLLALPSGAALADSKDGTFPTADQVGGEVYIDPIAPGKKLPTDFEAYDLNGNKIDFGQVIAGNGVIAGSVVFGRGSTLSPGPAAVLPVSAGLSPVAVPEPSGVMVVALAIAAAITATLNPLRAGLRGGR